jgi:hypothetical protein
VLGGESGSVASNEAGIGLRKTRNRSLDLATRSSLVFLIKIQFNGRKDREVLTGIS